MKYGGGKYDGAQNDIFLFRLWNRDTPLEAEWSQVRVVQDGDLSSRTLQSNVPWGIAELRGTLEYRILGFHLPVDFKPSSVPVIVSNSAI